jgi:CTP:molybdopterin cytidylyltransferase MocA
VATRAAPPKASKSQRRRCATTIILFDQPLVTADAVNRIVEARYTTGQDIVVSEYEDTL